VFYTVVSVLMVIAVAILRPRTVSKGSPSNETGGFFASHPILIPIIVLTVVGVLYFLWPRLKPRLLSTWHKAKEGAAIFRDRRRYLREVALPQGASYGCRIGVNVVFMAAFGIPVTAYTVFLVASSHTLSQLFAITPGGVGQTQALDVATLRRYASSGDIAAFSVTQDAVITIWNVVLGLVVMLWAFGWTQVRQLLSKEGRKQAQEQPGVDQRAVLRSVMSRPAASASSLIAAVSCSESCHFWKKSPVCSNRTSGTGSNVTPATRS